MDQLVITDSGVTEVLASSPDVELVLTNQAQDVVIEGTVGPQGPTGTIGPEGPQGPAGPQGLTGPAGAGGGSDAYFKQDFAPATTVTVTHNLGKYPAVSVFTSAGDEVEAEVDHLSINELTIMFAAANGGTVICN